MGCLGKRQSWVLGHGATSSWARMRSASWTAALLVSQACENQTDQLDISPPSTLTFDQPPRPCPLFDICLILSIPIYFGYFVYPHYKKGPSPKTTVRLEECQVWGTVPGTQ